MAARNELDQWMADMWHFEKPVVFDMDMSSRDFLALIYLLKVHVEVIDLKSVFVVGGHISHGNSDKGNVFTVPSNKYAEFNISLASIDWKSFGLNIKSSAIDEDGDAVLEWENLPPLLSLSGRLTAKNCHHRGSSEHICNLGAKHHPHLKGRGTSSVGTFNSIIKTPYRGGATATLSEVGGATIVGGDIPDRDVPDTASQGCQAPRGGASWQPVSWAGILHNASKGVWPIDIKPVAKPPGCRIFDESRGMNIIYIGSSNHLIKDNDIIDV
ncbi:hypothetical protein Syun_016945 [Stephania yunnanensis]|uniref:Uncharacterized protein n=1 Tax=Stephania yunnanensis TaxID=152371 RepID=A0AAP0J893_9MAGN